MRHCPPTNSRASVFFCQLSSLLPLQTALHTSEKEREDLQPVA
jgi:hypothetical protein